MSATSNFGVQLGAAVAAREFSRARARLIGRKRLVIGRGGETRETPTLMAVGFGLLLTVNDVWGLRDVSPCRQCG
jgi:hypothetical protein